MACGSKTPATCTTNADCSGSTSFCNANSSCVSPPQRLVFLTKRYALPGAAYATPGALDIQFHFQSLAEADQACADEASAANRKPQSPKGTFMAYLTTGNTSVLSRFTPHIFSGDSRPVYQPGNATNVLPLLTYNGSVLDMIPNGGLAAIFSRDAGGETMPNSVINFWTGIPSATGSQDCSGWKVTTGLGTGGTPTRTTAWTEAGGLPCNYTTAPLLCIEVDQ